MVGTVTTKDGRFWVGKIGPLLSVFCEKKFGVYFILDYDSMCSEMDFILSNL